MKILTAEQMKIVEINAVENGMTFLRLMENAGSACARIIRETYLLSNNVPNSIAIVCGRGKNGGDGFVIARKLYEAGYPVNVLLAWGNPKDFESIEMMKTISRLPIKIVGYDDNTIIANGLINDADIVVDAIFGTGFTGITDQKAASLFIQINQSHAVKVSIDIPSGLNCNNGSVLENCIHADLTIAISDLKPVHVLVPASQYCGKSVVADIGIPEQAYFSIDTNLICSIDDDNVKHSFKPVELTSHKGSFGQLLCVCGSMNMPGAAVFAAKGAVLSGAGLVTVAFPKSAYPAISAKLSEPVLMPLETTREGTLSAFSLNSLLKKIKSSNALLIGCGLGLNGDTIKIVKNAIMAAECPLILDADGINAICDDKDIIKNKNIVLTPHPGEMSRLTGLSVEYIQENRVKIASEFAAQYGVVLVLKGANTVIAAGNGHCVYLNTTGNPGMATGGSGDLLAGIIASFAAQGMTVIDSAKAGVYIHGLSGDAALLKSSYRGLTPTACLKELPAVIARFESVAI